MGVDAPVDIADLRRLLSLRETLRAVLLGHACDDSDLDTVESTVLAGLWMRVGGRAVGGDRASRSVPALTKSRGLVVPSLLLLRLSFCSVV